MKINPFLSRLRWLWIVGFVSSAVTTTSKDNNLLDDQGSDTSSSANPLSVPATPSTNSSLPVASPENPTRPLFDEFLKVLKNSTAIEELDAQFISLFVADAFAPKEYDGGNEQEILSFFQTLLKNSKDSLKFFNLENYFLKLEKVLNDVENTLMLDKPSEILLDKIKSLKEANNFKDCENSLVVHSGFPEHAMLCEFMRIKLDENNKPSINGKLKLAILVYNSGDGLQYHFKKHINDKIKYSPVMIFVKDWNIIDDGEFFKNWLKVFSFLPNDDPKYGAEKYYTVLFNDFDHVPLDSGVYDVFLTDQITGTCSVSCYHFYFSYKFGETNYNKIKTIMATKLLYTFFIQNKDSKILGKSMLEKSNLDFDGNVLKIREDSLGSPVFFETSTMEY